MDRYLFPAAEAQTFNKHGIDITVYEGRCDTANVVRVHVMEGHFQEFYDVASTYIYLILDGSGEFHVNDKVIRVGAGDLLVMPPGTRIHYFGAMDMVLTVSPAFDATNERHVRFIDRRESPYSSDRGAIDGAPSENGS
jgi:mannose-6-phosphate isomerase-like protein (cupin superfamily)